MTLPFGIENILLFVVTVFNGFALVFTPILFLKNLPIFIF